jgi:hypothetical protein
MVSIGVTSVGVASVVAGSFDVTAWTFELFFRLPSIGFVSAAFLLVVLVLLLFFALIIVSFWWTLMVFAASSHQLPRSIQEIKLSKT